jgi:nardilysin
MDYHSMKRADIQALAKANGIKANQKTDVLIAALKERGEQDAAPEQSNQQCCDLDQTKATDDKRSYRLLTLENGLRVVLVSDLRVQVGHAEDKTVSSGNADGSEDESEMDDEDGEESGADGGESGGSAGDEEGSESDEGEGDEGEGDEGDEGDEDGAKRAAASLAVGIGSFSDPASAPGLAHFLEHMVFLGCEKYPKENELDAFLAKVVFPQHSA